MMLPIIYRSVFTFFFDALVSDLIFMPNSSNVVGLYIHHGRCEAGGYSAGRIMGLFDSHSAYKTYVHIIFFKK